MKRYTLRIGSFHCIMYRVGRKCFCGRGCHMRALSAWINRNA